MMVTPQFDRPDDRAPMARYTWHLRGGDIAESICLGLWEYTSIQAHGVWDGATLEIEGSNTNRAFVVLYELGERPLPLEGEALYVRPTVRDPGPDTDLFVVVAGRMI